MKHFGFNRYWLAGAFLSILLVLGLSKGATAADTMVSVSYRLKWLFNCSTVGDNWANEKGLFAQKGLKVTVKAGGPERDAIKELELGYAQFGVASADQVIRARAKGAKVVVIAQLFQINPLQWIYRPEKFTINKLADLKGKILGVTFGGNDEAIMRTLLAKGGIAEKEVTLFSVRYDYTPFYQRKVDLWPVYRNTQGIFIGDQLKKAGEPFAFFAPADYGVKFVANSVVTSAGMLEKEPQVVAKFLDALMQGWRQALAPSNQGAALDMLQHFDKDSSVDVLKRQLDTTRELVKPRADTKIGTIDVAAWKMTAQLMLTQKQIDRAVDIEAALKPFPKLY